MTYLPTLPLGTVLLDMFRARPEIYDHRGPMTLHDLLVGARGAQSAGEPRPRHVGGRVSVCWLTVQVRGVSWRDVLSFRVCGGKHGGACGRHAGEGTRARAVPGRR